MLELNPQIYVVDDDVLFHHLLSVTLEDQYPGLKFFQTGEDFLCRIASGEVPDIVVLDYDIGTMSGLEVLKGLQKYLPDVKVVMLTAQEDVEVAVRAIKAGVYDYIVKNSNAMKNLQHSIRNLQDVEPGIYTWNEAS